MAADAAKAREGINANGFNEDLISNPFFVVSFWTRAGGVKVIGIADDSSAISNGMAVYPGRVKLLSIAAFALLVFWGCCSESDEIDKERGTIDLKPVSRLDTLNIFYESQFTNPSSIRVYDRVNPALEDTVTLRFFGTEQYYHRRIQNSIEIDSMNVQVFHHALDSMNVAYLSPDSSTKVLAKTACPPTDPGFRVDSIFVSHSSKVAITLEIK